MAVTFEDVNRLLRATPAWTWPARQLRLSQRTAWDLSSAVHWPESVTGQLTLCGLPVALDDTVPYGTIHCEIYVPDPPRGLV